MKGIIRMLLTGGLAALVLLGAALPCHADDRRVIVSLGDSFSAGEGIEPFYGEDAPLEQKVHNPDWLAHRSTKSWPGLLTLDGVDGPMNMKRDENWFFVAASGAETRHIRGEFEKPVSIGDIQIDKEHSKLEPQINVFDELREEHLQADYVTMTMGGNDAGFVSVVNAAFVLNSYLDPNGLSAKMNEVWSEYYHGKEDAPDEEAYRRVSIEKRLVTVYKDIAETSQTGDNPDKRATILVAGYPQLLSADGCLVFPRDNCLYVNYNVSLFNQRIKGLVDDLREKENIPIYFVSVEEYFAGHEAYSGNVGNLSYINDVIPVVREEDLIQSSSDILDLVASSSSMHPNQFGAEAYAQAVQDTIDMLERGEQVASPEPPAESSPDAEQDPGQEPVMVGDEIIKHIEHFDIVGEWLSVGDYGFGQAQPGHTTTFDGTHCNFYSPEDTYTFTEEDDHYILETENILWKDVLQFRVDTVSNDRIIIRRINEEGVLVSNTTVLQRTDTVMAEPVATDAPIEQEPGEIPAGTYVCSFYGLVDNSFTFYPGWRISMNALGINGSGTYRVDGDKMIITYTIPLITGSKEQVIEYTYHLDGDKLTIGEDTLVKQP